MSLIWITGGTEATRDKEVLNQATNAKVYLARYQGSSPKYWGEYLAKFEHFLITEWFAHQQLDPAFIKVIKFSISRLPNEKHIVSSSFWPPKDLEPYCRIIQLGKDKVAGIAGVLGAPGS